MLKNLNGLKKILILFGSPHINGFTAKALDQYLTSQDNVGETLFIDTYKKNARPCIDCRYCRKNDGCIYDDMNDICSAFETVDKIVFATPVYNLSFPSPMKSVIDRMQRFYSARFFRNINPVVKKHKEATIIITCGSNEMFGVEVVIKQVKQVASIINCSVTDKIIVNQTDLKIC